MGERQRGSRRPDRWSFTSSGRAFQTVSGVAAVVAAFGLGRLSVTPPSPPPIYNWNPNAATALVQNADPRELIPLPMPGAPDGQGQQPPGQQGQAQCPLYFFQDGQFFQLRPGESGPDGPLGQGNPELFPLDPVPPGAPAPGQPGPQNPTPRRPGPRNPGPQNPGPQPPDQQQPREPFFRTPGLVVAPSPAPLEVAGIPMQPADLGFLLEVSMSGLPGR